jgi:hypothetical protein
MIQRAHNFDVLPIQERRREVARSELWVNTAVYESRANLRTDSLNDI